MKKLIIVLLSICMCLSLTSCSLFESPAEAKRIGYGIVQQDNGIYFVEIDGIRYVSERIYTNSNGSRGRNSMSPAEKVPVTAFTLRGENKVYFIVGDLDEQYLEKYFTDNNTAYVFVMCFLLLSILISAFSGKKVQKVPIVRAD